MPGVDAGATFDASLDASAADGTTGNGDMDASLYDVPIIYADRMLPDIAVRDVELKVSVADPTLDVQQLRLYQNGVPVLGALFRSQDYVKDETELVVMVTPYVVRAVAQQELSRPDDGFAPSSDAQSALLARINRIYGLAARIETVGGYQGNFGFIID